VVGGCLVGFSISWNIANAGSVATLLARRYGTGLAVIGLLTTVLFFTELAVMVPGGRAIDRYGAKRVGLVAIAICLAANLLLIVPTDPASALVLRAFGGIGVGLGFLGGAVYAQSQAGDAAPLAGGIYGGASLGGGGVALAVVPQLVPAFAWRAPYVSGAVVAALALLAVLGCPPTIGHGGRGPVPALRTLLADRGLLRLGLISSVSFGFSVILGNWVVTLLERTAGLHRSTAGAIGSLILIVGIAGRPAGGVLARASAARTRALLGASFVAGAVGTALVALSGGRGLDAAAAALIGLAAGIPFGVTVAGATALYAEASGAAIGAMNIYPVGVVVCGTPLVGLTFSLPGDGRIGFAVVAALWLAALATLPGLMDGVVEKRRYSRKIDHGRGDG
jgi:MFS family permease